MGYVSEIIMKITGWGWFETNPPSGHYKILIRNNKLILRNSLGVETEVGGGAVSSGCIRRGDYVSPISYIGVAPTGSLETDPVWTITKIVSNPDGTIASETVFTNVKWSDHLIL